MRTIEYTSQFRRDYKRIVKGKYKSIFIDKLKPIVKEFANDSRLEVNEWKSIVEKLANDNPLEARYCDHPLSNNWKDHRDCHIRPDLILIYRKQTDTVLQLVRIGSHSDLGI